MPDQPKRVAALVTEYRRHSHADVIVGKILEGFNYDGMERPQMRLASMYVDQSPDGDMSRALAQRYDFRIYDRMEDAITLGRNDVSVDGVLVIGEHGRYDRNDRGQILYPRRRFFEAATNVMARHRKPVPIFNDKHLAVTWEDARWMYDRARTLGAPFMAGSSVPLTWRRPETRLAMNCELTEVVQVGYGPFEGYGFHALEGLQCMVERRRGGEVGVRNVQCLQGDAMWTALDRGVFSRELLELAMARCPAHARGDFRPLTARNNEAGVFLIEYRDGFKAAVVMPNGWVHEGDGGAFTFAGRVRGQEQPLSFQFYLQNLDPFGHFSYLVRAIDNMMRTNHPAYPVERTLLTTGILEAVMISRHERNRVVDTEHLDIRYRPVDWPFATDPVPARVNR
jgi:hypothetical protein